MTLQWRIEQITLMAMSLLQSQLAGRRFPRAEYDRLMMTCVETALTIQAESEKGAANIGRWLKEGPLPVKVEGCPMCGSLVGQHDARCRVER